MPYIPIDYADIFSNRTIIITGVGRSGTTILGKLIGSMERTAYLFEPAIMKYCLPNCTTGFDIRAFLGTLFEDYFLPIVQARALNYCTDDDSWIRHYWSGEQIVKAISLRRRSEAVEWARKSGLRFIIKTNELEMSCRDLNDVFPGVKVVHIIRNGNDVIHSALKKGWYTDGYMKESCLERVDRGTPLFIGFPESIERIRWIGYNQTTRIACVWRSLVTRDADLSFKYEDLAYCPEVIVDWTTKNLGLTRTMLTIKHLADIKNRGRKQYESLLDEIQEPERTLYCQTLESLGYQP